MLFLLYFLVLLPPLSFSFFFTRLLTINFPASSILTGKLRTKYAQHSFKYSKAIHREVNSCMGGSQRRRGRAEWNGCPKHSFWIFHNHPSLCMPIKRVLGVHYSLKCYFQCLWELVTFSLTASCDLFIVPILKICLLWHFRIYEKYGNMSRKRNENKKIKPYIYHIYMCDIYISYMWCIYIIYMIYISYRSNLKI